MLSFVRFYGDFFVPAQQQVTLTSLISFHPFFFLSRPLCSTIRYYACDIKLKGAVPGPVVNFLSKTALKTATSWVKKESEKNPKGKKPAFVPSKTAEPATSKQ